MKIISEICPVCHSRLTVGVLTWHFVCKQCRYECSNLEPTINTHSSHELIDEAAREAGLRDTRLSNYKKFLRSIKLLKPDGGRLLDVGCAHGWFLESAQNDFNVVGLEPEKRAFDATTRRGLSVRFGYFPAALDDEEKFDVIVFNDVIEHIPDMAKTLRSCHRFLATTGGLLVLNLPSSDGIFYKLSKLLCHFGFCGFFERLWQKDLPSPHLHYFNVDNLSYLLIDGNFEVKAKSQLSTVNLSGLYKRISYAGNLSTFAYKLVYVGVALGLPIIKFLPSDIICIIAEKELRSVE